MTTSIFISFVLLTGVTAILLWQFREKNTKVSFQNPQDLEFDDHGGHDAPV